MNSGSLSTDLGSWHRSNRPPQRGKLGREAQPLARGRQSSEAAEICALAVWFQNRPFLLRHKKGLNLDVHERRGRCRQLLTLYHLPLWVQVAIFIIYLRDTLPLLPSVSQGTVHRLWQQACGSLCWNRGSETNQTWCPACSAGERVGRRPGAPDSRCATPKDERPGSSLRRGAGASFSGVLPAVSRGTA